MKTRTYRLLRLFGNLMSAAAILASLAFVLYVGMHIRLLHLEGIVMSAYRVTIKSATKYLVLSNITVCLLASYSLNIAQRLLMRLALLLVYVQLVIGGIACYRFWGPYASAFRTGVLPKIYETLGFSTALQNYYPWLGLLACEDALKADMGRMCRMLVLYEVLCCVCLLGVATMLVLGRHVRISLAPVTVPAIAEASKVGLSTGSLRTRRLVPAAPQEA